MKVYSNFLGIDIGKFNFVVATHANKTTKEYENNHAGVKLFIQEYKKYLKDSLCVLETTGGYEKNLLHSLCDKKLAVHRAHTRQVKSFVRSLGNGAKTDALDAKALALYGYERSERLALFEPLSAQQSELQELVQRRDDLIAMLIAEKNRSQGPSVVLLGYSFKALIEVLSQQVQGITERISLLIDQDSQLKMRKKILMSIPGIGEITANNLLVTMPELGTLNRREIASLAGVAPRANDSGQHKGYRTISPGRKIIKKALFIAAMAARNSNSPFKAFYEKLIGKGKKKMVALVALMRKIVIIANAKLKELGAEKMNISS